MDPKTTLTSSLIILASVFVIALLIVSLISIQEMTFVGTEIANSSGLIFEIWLIIGLFYFLLCLSLSVTFKSLEKKSRRYLKS